MRNCLLSQFFSSSVVIVVCSCVPSNLTPVISVWALNSAFSLEFLFCNSGLGSKHLPFTVSMLLTVASRGRWRSSAGGGGGSRDWCCSVPAMCLVCANAQPALGLVTTLPWPSWFKHCPLQVSCLQQCPPPCPQLWHSCTWRLVPACSAAVGQLWIRQPGRLLSPPFPPVRSDPQWWVLSLSPRAPFRVLSTSLYCFLYHNLFILQIKLPLFKLLCDFLSPD